LVLRLLEATFFEDTEEKNLGRSRAVVKKEDLE
jgi:hypothetical protein